MIFSPEKLRLLIIEDSDENAFLIEDYLEKQETDYALERVKTHAQAQVCLSKNNAFDAIFIDLSLPESSTESSAKELVTQMVALAGAVPLIAFTEDSDRVFGINALKWGATDLLIKRELTPPLLSKSISYAIERKHIYNALKQSEKEYKTLFEANPQPMWIYDLETLQFLHVNDAAIRQYGYSKEEFLAMTIKDIRPPLDIDRLIKNVRSNRISSDFSTGFFRHIKKNGEIIFVDVKSNSIDFGAKNARLVLSTDITEQVNAEASLKFREQRFKALVQHGSDLIAILDLEGNYKYVSPTIKTILGISESALVGKNAFNFIHEEDKENVKKIFSLISTQKRIDIPPFRFKDNNDNWRWIETTVTDMSDDPAVEGIVSNARDVTERKKYLEAIKAQNQKLLEIAWTQSHVVRAPLARILGLVDLLANHSTNERDADLMHHMLSSAQELDNILRNIVRKTEQVKAQYDPGP